jgi:alkanesulfonate monooxygenase SsuD/methylene tetrahydromethanopterin reductase-like flavin-dependent oxidoreductase (luciferase family)
MPCRNLVPKSLQKPHPPMWVACSRRETIHRAARAGLGALTFAFIEPELAAKWINEYYDIIKSEECVPIGHAVNANVALVSGMSCHTDEEEAIRRGLDGFRFFGYSLGYVGIFGDHRPGITNMWERFLEVKDRLPDNAGRGGIGTPAQLRAHLEGYENAGVDQVIFVQQSGRNRHDHICESLELFASSCLPAFKERDAVREAKKQAELAPYIAAALARKPRMPPIDPADIPLVESFGRRGGKLTQQMTSTFASDRGGAISIPATDMRQHML